MNDVDILYSVNKSNAIDIALHLLHSDGQFTPPLSQRVDIESYASRIADHAMRFEAWIDGSLIALVAAYFNIDENRFYITNVSTASTFGGKGIAKSLLKHCLEYADNGPITIGYLEVQASNAVALSLYCKCGFEGFTAQVDRIQMRRTRPSNLPTLKGTT